MTNDWPHPAPIDKGGAAHLVPGLEMPNVDLESTVGELISLGRTAGLTVVFIYPWTGRPGHPNPPGWDGIPGAHGSTPQAEGFRDLFDEFFEIGVQVCGLSAQDNAWQCEAAERLKLPFILLSDVDLALAEALSLPRFEAGGETYLERMTLVIEEGALVHAFYPVHPPHTHAAEVLAWVRARMG